MCLALGLGFHSCHQQLQVPVQCQLRRPQPPPQHPQPLPLQAALVAPRLQALHRLTIHLLRWWHRWCLPSSQSVSRLLFVIACLHLWHRCMVIWLSDLCSWGQRFNSRPFHLHAVTLGQLFTHKWLVAWHSGRTSVFGRRAFPVLCSTCSWWVTTYVGKPSAIGQPTRPTKPFILSRSIN